MLASERLLEIEEKFEATVERIVPVELDGETLRVVLHQRLFEFLLVSYCILF